MPESKNAKSKGIPTRGKAIRLHCIECSGDNRTEVRHCLIPGCHLYPYRMGSVAEGLRWGPEGRVSAAAGKDGE